MKFIFYQFILLLIIVQVVYPQNYDVNHKVGYPQINHKYPSLISPNSSQSAIETVNGFDNFRLGTDFAESMIATNPNDPLNSVCTFARSKLYYTLDGLNWFNASVIYSSQPDNFVCYDSLGNAYFIEFVANNLLILKSSNKGINWSNYNIYTATGTVDKPSITAVQSGGLFTNYIYSTWQYDLQVSRSTNGGINWSNPTIVSSNSFSYCPWIAVGPNGNIPGGNLYCGYNI
jgi:hypothetical protein